ncbi:hypothetical protein B0H10DRAFT_2208626 [Mycena sp. CBHHK59/15]|nr:hypothetical protein B0H10DRAFT_2208626 [Mycena sp. CBHHK59/15]
MRVEGVEREDGGVDDVVGEEEVGEDGSHRASAISEACRRQLSASGRPITWVSNRHSDISVSRCCDAAPFRLSCRCHPSRTPAVLAPAANPGLSINFDGAPRLCAVSISAADLRLAHLGSLARRIWTPRSAPLLGASAPLCLRGDSAPPAYLRRLHAAYLRRYAQGDSAPSIYGDNTQRGRFTMRAAPISEPRAFA